MNRDALNALDQTVAIARQRAGGRIPIVGVAGPQGSGKTTLVAAYASAHPSVAHFSLDDVYFEKDVRLALARDVHPLFATRGVPSTHDMMLFEETIEHLLSSRSMTPIPAFDKLADDRLPFTSWPVFQGPAEAILVDGWCLGAQQAREADLVDPINQLEAEQDKGGEWRRLVNLALGAYSVSFDLLDAVLYLRAPSFDVVHEWRCEQEEGLLGRDLTSADRRRIALFIQHFERITRHMMSGGRRADIEVQLDAERNVTKVKRI
jgi:D-glycerate 3-kinase